MWFLLAAASAIFLGVYEVLKKVSVTSNAVLPVLLFSTVASSLVMLPVWFASHTGILSQEHLLYIPATTPREHLLIFIKTIIVLISWIFTYFALKHLPITIVSPIRATGPLWTLMGAIIIFREQLSWMQWCGIGVTLTFFYLFSTSGHKEGISFRNNKWIWFIILGTLSGAASSLYDKFLLKQIHRMSVQCYFTFYQVAIMLPVVALLWWPKRASTTPFKWKWSIPLIGITLLVTDFLYFFALSHPESLVSVVSAIRRGSVVIAFIVGAWVFKEKRIREKGVYLAGILAGIALLLFGSAH
ncbi:MAG: EamA family transporter [Marinilabiliaceae bacterium]|nr:EamA family transporter [Marinilabiliaceae bacterium]